MIDEVKTEKNGAVGIITLNRPKAINALNQNMIDIISKVLSAWLVDDEVKAIFMEGAGERGFCAGGDVRAVRTQVLEGRLDEADAFFESEYALNEMISTSSKPIIVLTHGVVMGGGIGLAGHASIRIAASNCKFAMPESAIGLTCDVGANALLVKAPEVKAYLFLLSGLPVDGHEAQELNLTDYVISPESLSEVRELLIALVNSGELDEIDACLSRYYAPKPNSEFDIFTVGLQKCFDHQYAGDVLNALSKECVVSPDLAKYYEVLMQRCPTSLEVILQNFRATQLFPSIHAVLQKDKELVFWLIRRQDFSDGVNAVLIDKTGVSEWHPQKFADIDVTSIQEVMSKK